MSNIETIQNQQANEENEEQLPANGMYLHDMVSDYDSAVDTGEHTGEVHEDDIHEKPGAGFHDENMYGEGERQSDGARINEATGEFYKGDVDEETLARQQLGHVVAADELELVLDAPLEEDDDATAQWLKMVEANSGEEAKREANAQWLAQKKRQ